MLFISSSTTLSPRKYFDNKDDNDNNISMFGYAKPTAAAVAKAKAKELPNSASKSTTKTAATTTTTTNDVYSGPITRHRSQNSENSPSSSSKTIPLESKYITEVGTSGDDLAEHYHSNVDLRSSPSSVHMQSQKTQIDTQCQSTTTTSCSSALKVPASVRASQILHHLGVTPRDKLPKTWAWLDKREAFTSQLAALAATAKPAAISSFAPLNDVTLNSDGRFLAYLKQNVTRWIEIFQEKQDAKEEAAEQSTSLEQQAFLADNDRDGNNHQSTNTAIVSEGISNPVDVVSSSMSSSSSGSAAIVTLKLAEEKASDVEAPKDKELPTDQSSSATSTEPVFSATPDECCRASGPPDDDLSDILPKTFDTHANTAPGPTTELPFLDKEKQKVDNSQQSLFGENGGKPEKGTASTTKSPEQPQIQTFASCLLPKYQADQSEQRSSYPLLYFSYGNHDHGRHCNNLNQYTGISLPQESENVFASPKKQFALLSELDDGTEQFRYIRIEWEWTCIWVKLKTSGRLEWMESSGDDDDAENEYKQDDSANSINKWDHPNIQRYVEWLRGQQRSNSRNQNPIPPWVRKDEVTRARSLNLPEPVYVKRVNQGMQGLPGGFGAWIKNDGEWVRLCKEGSAYQRVKGGVFGTNGRKGGKSAEK